MTRKALGVVVGLTLGALANQAAWAGPSSAPSDTGRISAEEAAALAVNQVTPTAAGYHLCHPRREVDFTPYGVRLEGMRGAPEWTWSLEEISSSSGRQLLDAAPVAPVAVDGTLIRYDRCLLNEDYRLRQNSVEQLLVIPEPPPLDGGDLVVAGRVSCEGTFAEEERGWTWRGARGEVTMGRVTVLDADKKELPARLEVSATSTRLVVDGTALLAASYPVVVDPEIGSNDYRISDMGPDGDPDWDAFDPAVAYNSINNTYLVVWAGDDTPGGQVDEEYEVFGQVLSASGSQLGYSDVRISYAGGTGSYNTRAFRPAVAFNSNYNEYLVVWSADNPEDGCVDNEFEIWGQVIDPWIFPLYGGNFRISYNGGSGDPAFDADNPAVVYNPDFDEYLVVWDGDDNSGGMVDGESEIWAQRVYSTGILVGSNLRMSDMGGTGNADYDAFDPDVAYNSQQFEYLIVWYGDDNSGSLVDEEFEIYGQLIDYAGGGVGPNDYRLSDMGGIGDVTYGAFHPSVAYNPLANQYLVVWLGDDNVGGLVDNEFEVFSQRLDADLNGLGSNDFRLSDAGGVGDADYDVMWGPEVAFNALTNQYMVVWGGEDTVDGMVNNEWEIFAQMLSWNIQGVGPNDERISDVGGLGNTLYMPYSPVVAANSWNGQFLVAWYGDDNVGTLVQGENEVFIQRMDGMDLFSDAFESGDTGAWSSATP